MNNSISCNFMFNNPFRTTPVLKKKTELEGESAKANCWKF